MENRAALIMIDMQNGFLDPASPCCIAGAAATVPACAEVLRFCRATGVPVFFVTRRYRADGSNVEHTRYPAWAGGGKPISPGCAEAISDAMPEAFGSDARDYHVIKPRFSAFFGTELDLMLRRLGVRTIVLAGTTTPNCIRTTCYDGISLEYNVAVLTDCTSSATDEIQRSNLRDIEAIGAQLLSGADWISGAVTLRDNAAAVQAAVRQGR